MKLTLDADPRVNLIRAYGPGEVRVGERVIRTNCIVTASEIVADWSARSPEELQPADLERLFALTPEVVLLGTGDMQRFPPRAVRMAFLERQIALEPMDLGAACRTFNILVQEERRVAAALFVE
ncbi:MAG TPA: Mth938-like domain-containing protein [Steroidobacteraceae bacterium]|nr:Mth938-like domain-containing protein [Steroidobacteraceae bacterium]